jgi:signal transduction histidine kinase
MLHPEEWRLFDVLENQLNRLLDIQQKADHIIQYNHSLNEVTIHQELNQLWKGQSESPGAPSHFVNQWKELDKKMTRDFLANSIDLKTVNLFPLVQNVLDRTKQMFKHRNILILTDAEENLCIPIDPKAIEEIFEGLLKNAIENTPDEGIIRIILETKGERGFFKVQDFGIGITEENQKYIFDGLFATREMDLYSSKNPYDFYAGGKGLDLFKMKIYGQHFGFDISMKSQRCVYLPTDRDLCPGRISQCPHCKNPLDCYSSGGSTFCLSFPVSRNSK